MPNPDNEPQIPKNQSPISDDRTGLVSRDWYRFFLNLLNKANTGGGSGTVTSVSVSGGSTGLTTSGGPVTTSGTITLAGTLDVDIGGTGATTAAGALTSLGAYPASNPNGYTSNTGTVTSVAATVPSILSVAGSPITTSGTLAITYSGTALPIANGGTGQTTAAAAITALTGTQTSGQYLRSDGTNAALSAIQVADVPTLNQNTTGTASNVTGTVAIANGGTGQTTASAAFNALSPVTSTGDLILGNGANSSTRLPIGTVNYVLTSNGTTATWAVATGSGATITNDTTTATNVYPTFAAATSGSLSTIYTSNAKLLYKPSTGELTSSHLVAGNGIVVNNLTVGTSYTIAAGTSGMSAGPITVSGGVVVTVASGSRWVVV